MVKSVGQQRLRLFEMLVAVIPVTQVQPHRDLSGHLVHAAHQARDDGIEGLRAARREGLLKDAELHRDIPLH